MPSGTHYEILQVQPTANFEIIQAAYRRMMLRYHLVVTTAPMLPK
ncbi:MAG: J domain-containing protein [Dehalococcoidia bacterium]|nr:J domain-containing protein [Dehalococcoidia bacterium]